MIKRDRYNHHHYHEHKYLMTRQYFELSNNRQSTSFLCQLCTYSTIILFHNLFLNCNELIRVGTYFPCCYSKNISEIWIYQTWYFDSIVICQYFNLYKNKNTHRQFWWVIMWLRGYLINPMQHSQFLWLLMKSYELNWNCIYFLK